MRGDRFALALTRRRGFLSIVGREAGPARGRGALGRVITYQMRGEEPAQWQGMKALMHVTLPPLGPHSPAFHFAPLVALLEGVIEVNRCHIRQSLNRAAAGVGQPIPPLYASGVVYREDPFGQENWGDVLYCLQCMFADCDRLILWRCAEVREAGVWVEPVIKWQHLTREVRDRVRLPRRRSRPRGRVARALLRPLARVLPDPTARVAPARRAVAESRPAPPERRPRRGSQPQLGMGGEYTSHA